jgi:Holliday junction resolvasome RuvABC endonuclease subunit
MIILALDCATKTGWALMQDGKLVESGVEKFEAKRGESPGLRFLRFRTFIDRMAGLMLERAAAANVGCVMVYEQAHHRGGSATELCVGMTTRVQEVAAANGIEYATVHTATLKKFATGSGRAGKPEMVEAARKRWGVEPADDNEADALMLAAYTISEML